MMSFLRTTVRHCWWLGIGLAWVISVLTVSGWLVQTTLHRQARALSPPGKMVLADGNWVHLDCRGDRHKPMMFLEAGAMGWSTVWSWFLQHGTKDHYVCTWDRAGMGWSQPTTLPATSQASARLLHDVLTAQRLNKHPFILVGHSLGGVYALTYQNMYPQDVRALVLLDPAHPQQLQRLPSMAVQKTFDQVSRLTTALPMLDFGVGRGVLEVRKTSSLYKLPERVWSSVVNVSTSRQHLDRSVQEYMSWPISAAAAAQTWDLGDLPLLVISSSDREQGNRQANEVWWRLHRDMAGLSRHGAWSIIPQTSHQSLIMKEESAELVLERIRKMEQSMPPAPITKPKAPR